MPERAARPSAIPITPGAPAPLVSLSDDNSRVVATIPAGDRVEVRVFSGRYRMLETTADSWSDCTWTASPQIGVQDDG